MNGPGGQQPQDTIGYQPSPFPEQSQSVLVFVIGLVGMFAFPLAAPFAWVLGNQELSAIDAGRRPADNRQLAKAGQILGILMSAFLILFAVLVFGLILVSLVAAIF